MTITSGEKKKRVSKKKKSSWRKHVNIQDVDYFLEDRRLEERLGESFSELKDEELFTIQADKEEKQLTAKQKKRLRLAAPPKCFAMLQPHTKVADPIRKRNHVRTREERMCPILRKKENERKLKGILKPKEFQSINDRKKYEQNRLKKNAETSIQDIWKVEEELCDNQWIDKNVKRHTLRGLGKLNKIIPRLTIDKNASIPNVEIPHPGTSYNPSFKDYNDLLQDISKKEMDIIKKEEHINRVTNGLFKKLSPIEADRIHLTDMSQGLLEEDKTSEIIVVKNDDDHNRPYKSVNPPVVNNKKTNKQRRKKKEQLLLQKERLLAKLEKKKTVDIHKLKLIKQQIENYEKRLQIRKENREKVKLLRKKEPKQLSKLKYEEPDVEFNMGQDLSGNLRNIKKEGNLLADRFRSFQKRNILEVTARQSRKKAKVKKFVKPGFKDNWKKTVANINLINQ